MWESFRTFRDTVAETDAQIQTDIEGLATISED